MSATDIDTKDYAYLRISLKMISEARMIFGNLAAAERDYVLAKHSDSH